MNNLISLEQAVAMTSLYRAERDNILKPEFLDKNILLTCETFERAAFDKLLAFSGCVGVRIYFGMNEDLQVKCILVGTDSSGKDILPKANVDTSVTAALESADDGGETADDDEPPIVEIGQPCPPVCPPPSGLNP